MDNVAIVVEDLQAKSRVTARLTFVPPNAKRFTILSHTSRLGERVVREVLEGEVTAVATYQATALSPANYDFHSTEPKSGTANSATCSL